MENKIMLVVLDGNRVVDKLKVNRKHINKTLDNSTVDDMAAIVSPEVGEFLNKYC